MPTIPEYTRGIIKPRETPQLVNMQAIQDAGAVARGVAQVADMGAELAFAHQRANEATAVNDAIIAKQKDDLEYIDQLRKQNEGNPFDFAKRVEPDIQKRDEERAKDLPSAAARKAYMETSKRLNLGIYEQNFSWENQRKAAIYAQRIENSINNNNLLALRAGRDGIPLDDFIKNADATSFATGGVLSPEKIMDVNRQSRQQAAAYWLDGITGRNPYEAKEYLETRKLDVLLGAEGLTRAYDQADKEIKRREKEAEEAKLVSDLLQGLRPADPSNKDDRKIIDKLYSESGLIEGFQRGEIESIQETIGLIRQTSIIPNTVQSTVRGYIENGTADQKKMGYAFIGQLQEVKPTALTGAGGFTEKEIRDAAAYNSLIRSGATTRFAEDAVKAANSPMQEDVRNLREAQANKILGKMTAEAVQDEFGSGFFTLNPKFMGAENEARIFADYRNIYKEAYMKYGSEDVAHAEAMAAVKVNNDETYITGSKRLMAFPPEQYYGLPNLSIKENAEWMRAELENDLRTYGYSGDLEKVNLVPSINSKARVDQGLKPQYHLWVETEIDGMPRMDLLRDENNMPVTMGFDTEKRVKTEAKKREKDVMGAEAKRVTGVAVDQMNMPPFLSFVQKKVLSLAVDKEMAREKAKVERFYNPPKMIEDDGKRPIDSKFKATSRRMGQ